uniref:HTH CENPB-type domain-containing protein n=1 Tax=Globodera pallida TaxID=36090 RepID=A0A183BK65_GLOPA
MRKTRGQELKRKSLLLRQQVDMSRNLCNPSEATGDGEKDEDEPQLHDDDDGILVDRKRHRNNEATKKLDAIEWARRNSINSAAKKFRVDRKSIREWMEQEGKLNQQMNAGGGKRKRLDGGGRAVQHLNIDTTLADWIKEMRQNKKPVTRSIIKNKATALFVDTDIKVSNGWLEKLLKRHNFVLRRRTTAGQKPPSNYAEAVAKFIIYVEQRRQNVNFSGIYAMDETAVWFDCPDNRCIETKGAKEVMVVTTGHEKMRITVCLTARSDGRKLMPYVLVNRKRPVPKIVQQYRGKLTINFAGSTWMNDGTTEDYLHKIIGLKLFSGKRLLVWDAFASHKSAGTTKVLKELGVEAAYIPGGCTKFVQAPDVCWNKPFKERIRHYYSLWITNGDRQEYTAAGNPKAPALEIVLDWVDRSWQELSKELIIKSFEVCGLTTTIDGSGDDRIACFKPNGSIGARGIELLREFRGKETMKDGRNDEEEAGLSEDENNVDLGGVGEDDELFF